MAVGGVILGVAGIIMVVLVTNNRWDATWAGMLGNGAAPSLSQGAQQPRPVSVHAAPPANQTPTLPSTWQW